MAVVRILQTKFSNFGVCLLSVGWVTVLLSCVLKVFGTYNNNNDNNELTARLREQLEDSNPTRVWQYILPGMEWRKVTKGKEQLLSLYQKECETKK